MGWLLPYLENGVALLWSLPPLYIYLNGIGLIDEEIFVIAIQNTGPLKNQFESEIPNFKHKFNFIEFID